MKLEEANEGPRVFEARALEAERAQHSLEERMATEIRAAVLEGRVKG